MGTLVSKHFTIPKDRRFQDALDNDKDHIVPGANGDHVLRIQTALETLTGVDLGMDRGDYGSKRKTPSGPTRTTNHARSTTPTRRPPIPSSASGP